VTPKKKYLVSDLLKQKRITVNLVLEPCDLADTYRKSFKTSCVLEKKIKLWNSPQSNGISLDSRTIAKYAVVSYYYGDYAIHSLPMHSSMAQKLHSI
jgi:hypothetical protein